MSSNKYVFFRNYYFLITVMLLFLIGFNIFPTVARADGKNDLSFTMDVKPVENQIDTKATYYDLLVTPGQKQVLTVIVTNTGTDTKKIDVTPTNAITNQNGVIDYSKQSDDFKNDSTLKYPFTTLVGKAQSVELAPNESKEVNFDLSVPEESFQGMILGGFLVDLQEKEEEDSESSGGVKIVNKFQLVKAVRLRESEDTISPELKLNDVVPALVSYRTAVTANIQNTEPTMFGDMTVEANVTRKGQTEVIKSVTKKNLEMAPNSNFDFPIMWGTQRLSPGDYTLNLVATSGEKEWKFTKDFTITAEESDKINEEAVDLEEESTPYWIYIVIAVGLILLIIIIIVLVYFHKKKKREEEEMEKRKKKKKKDSNTKRRG